MSIPLIVEGNSYQYPAQGDKANTGWGLQATNWASAVTSALGKLGLGGTLSPIANAIINIDSTSKGILIPRMTTAQRDAIASPNNALLIFNTTLKVVQYYDSSVPAWISIGARLPDNAVFSGTLQVNGNITGLGALTLSGALQALTGNFTDTTDAVDVDTAPLKTLGGMAVKKKLFVGGQSLSSNGTVSLPGQSFASEPASGLYKIATNKFGIAINGSRIGEFGSGYGGFTGNVIQSLYFTNSYNHSTSNSSNWTTYILSAAGTTFEVSITPKYNNSKIILLYNFSSYLSLGSGNTQAFGIRIDRKIASGSYSSIYTGASDRQFEMSGSGLSSVFLGLQAIYSYEDSPNSTSQITYRFPVRVFNGSGSIAINLAGTSSINLIEIQQ